MPGLEFTPWMQEKRKNTLSTSCVKKHRFAKTCFIFVSKAHKYSHRWNWSMYCSPPSTGGRFFFLSFFGFIRGILQGHCVAISVQTGPKPESAALLRHTSPRCRHKSMDWALTWGWMGLTKQEREREREGAAGERRGAGASHRSVEFHTDWCCRLTTLATYGSSSGLWPTLRWQVNTTSLQSIISLLSSFSSCLFPLITRLIQRGAVFDIKPLPYFIPQCEKALFALTRLI